MMGKIPPPPPGMAPPIVNPNLRGPPPLPG